MKNLITFAIAIIIVAVNTVSAKTPNWTSIKKVSIDSIHVYTEFEAVQKINGKNVAVQLRVYTNSETTNKLVAGIKCDDGTVEPIKTSAISKTYSKVDWKQTEEGLTVSYEDKVTEKNVPIEIALAQK